MSNPTFTIKQEGKDFLICDEDGCVYGRYSTRKEAENVATEWDAYYSAPLIF